MCVYLSVKCEICIIILTSFKQGGRVILPPLPTSKRAPKKSTQIRVKLDGYVGSCNTLNDLPNKIYVPNKKRFKSKRFQHDSWFKRIKNINKAYAMQM